jgi:hypothetical protein
MKLNDKHIYTLFVNVFLYVNNYKCGVFVKLSMVYRTICSHTESVVRELITEIGHQTAYSQHKVPATLAKYTERSEGR